MQPSELSRPSTFSSWAIVELMDRSIIAGQVTEQTIGGQSFIRVDVPSMPDQPAFTKFYGGSAIYCLTPCDEPTARAAVEGLRQKPIEVYKLNLSLPSPSRVAETEEEEPPF